MTSYRSYFRCASGGCKGGDVFHCYWGETKGIWWFQCQCGNMWHYSVFNEEELKTTMRRCLFRVWRDLAWTGDVVHMDEPPHCNVHTNSCYEEKGAADNLVPALGGRLPARPGRRCCLPTHCGNCCVLKYEASLPQCFHSKPDELEDHRNKIPHQTAAGMVCDHN